MEVKTINNIEDFDFNVVDTYKIHKASGLGLNKDIIEMITKDTTYKYILNSKKDYDKIPLLSLFKKNGRYVFDRNKNKPYIIDSWQVSIIPELCIQKIK